MRDNLAINLFLFTFLSVKVNTDKFDYINKMLLESFHHNSVSFKILLELNDKNYVMISYQILI